MFEVPVDLTGDEDQAAFLVEDSLRQTNGRAIILGFRVYMFHLDLVTHFLVCSAPPEGVSI